MAAWGWVIVALYAVGVIVLIYAVLSNADEPDTWDAVEVVILGLLWPLLVAGGLLYGVLAGVGRVALLATKKGRN